MKDWLARLRAAKAGSAGILLVLLCCVFAVVMLQVFPAGDSGMTAEEQRISRTLSRIAGAGETRVAIYYAQEASAFGGSARAPVGAVVVARGAGDLAVRLQLQRAAETLLGLPASRVEIFVLEDAE
ncbi:MAG: hypothetical protein GX637_06975 [Clostridiales bacterium]|nr:hypothetical protein [Clostridiales bacterium]